MAGVQFSRGFDKLAKLQAGLKAVGSRRFRESVMKQLAIEGVHQVHASFEGSKDAYDAPWKKSKLTGRRKGGKTLQDTRRLFNSFSTAYNDRTFQIGSRVVYAAIHNYGGTVSRKGGSKTKRVVKRDSRGRIQKGSRFQEKTFKFGASSAGIPKRAFLPEQNKGLGRRWTAAFTHISDKLLKRAIAAGRAE
jgi:phage gpG-like protein